MLASSCCRPQVDLQVFISLEISAMALRSRSASKHEETPSNQATTRRVTRSASQDLTTPPASSKRSRTRSQSDLSTGLTKPSIDKTPDSMVMDTGVLIKTPDISSVENKESSKKKSSSKSQKKSSKNDLMETEEPIATPNSKKEKKDSSKKKSSKKHRKESKEEDEVGSPKLCENGESKRSLKRRSSEKVKKSPKKKRKEAPQSLDGIQEPATTAPKKPDPVVDVTVHRIRNLNYHPKPILRMAAEKTHGWLAISRESGCITLKAIVPKLRTVSVIAGSHRNPMTVLAWTRCCEGGDPVLVCASRNDGTLYVADFWNNGQLTARTLCAGGGIFCMEPIGPDSVAVGCQDGSIRIFSVQNKNDQYEFHLTSTIPSAGSPVLSIAAQPGQSIVLFASIADGTIRRYVCHSNNQSKSAVGGVADSFFASTGIIWKSTLRMTVECLGRSTPTRVWALKAAKDGTVVSGDSLGHVQFWDGNTGTLIGSFEQNDNKADVLDLDMTLDECKVFASGVDSRVVCIERSTAVARDGMTRSSQWIMTHAQRPHTHDIKAVVLVPNSKRDGIESEVLCTGGLDTKLCTYSVDYFAKRRPRTVYPWPGLKHLVSIAKTGRIIAMMREDRVDIYKLAKKEDAHLQHEPSLVQEDDILIGSVQVEGLANLMCSSVSDDGRLLAISDTFSLVLFHMVVDDDGSLVVSKVPGDIQGMGSMVAVRFLDNCRLVLVTADGRVVVMAISTNASNSNDVEIEKSESRGDVVQTILLPNKKSEGKESPKLFPVHTIVKSEDGRWIATIQNSTSSKDGSVHIFGCVDGSDSFQFWWTIPNLGSGVTAASFLLMDDLVHIAIACLDFSVYIFDVNGRRLSKWSEAAGFPVSRMLPLDIAHRNDYPVRLAVDSASPSTLLLVSIP